MSILAVEPECTSSWNGREEDKQTPSWRRNNVLWFVDHHPIVSGCRVDLCVFAVVLRGACYAEDHLCLCCHVEDYQGDHVPVAMSCLVPVCFVFLCLVYQSLSAASGLVCLMPLCYIPVSCAPHSTHQPPLRFSNFM